MEDSPLDFLAAGDSFALSGVTWAVRELHYYHDPDGYATREWRIESSQRGEYYLLREHDPARSDNPVWYLSERLVSPKLLSPSEGRNVFAQLKKTFSANVVPPASLNANGTTYLYESTSSCRADWDGTPMQRTTWEYWDTTHSRNLALEFWGNGELLVYQAGKVEPEAITDLQKGGAKQLSGRFFGKGRPGKLEWFCAVAMTLEGIAMLLMWMGVL